MSDIVVSSISLMNGAAVGIYGILLSASFCNIVWTKKRIWTMGISTGFLLLLQGVIFFLADDGAVRILYPFITHVPLVVVLWVLSKRFLWSIISVLVAYLCCQLRRWIALFVVALCSGDAFLQDTVELLITVPLLLMLLKFVAPAVCALSRDTVPIQWQFALIPVLSYVFDYVTQIYAAGLLKSSPVIMEFMYFICSVAYLGFVLRITTEKNIRSKIKTGAERSASSFCATENFVEYYYPP